MKKSMIILLVLSLPFFLTACQSSYSGGSLSRGCSTDTFVAMCAWPRLSGDYYCEQTAECVNYCIFKCFNSSYNSVISASGTTQKEELDLTRVYCTCTCKKCV